MPKTDKEEPAHTLRVQNPDQIFLK